MLPIKTRQTYLNAIGIPCGKVDGKWGPKCKAATLTLQKKYFTRKSDIDGDYGKNTDILLQCAYNFRDIKHFRLQEFKCKCGHCTGYPAVIDRQLILNLEYLRNKHGSIKITSGLRCKWKNSRLTGSAKNSRHLSGKAADIYNAALTGTRAKRNAFIKRWYTFKKARYAYGNTPNMGNAVHVDVK